MKKISLNHNEANSLYKYLNIYLHAQKATNSGRGMEESLNVLGSFQEQNIENTKILLSKEKDPNFDDSGYNDEYKFTEDFINTYILPCIDFAFQKQESMKFEEAITICKIHKRLANEEPRHFRKFLDVNNWKIH